ncbi:hypothetical protein [Spongiactinospora gelatinilytica]|uniref:hypothetical protein n=1 Tax=Spongiactinospora gelatinilytica TaxID=2666298 RepID=UPI001313E81A
MPCARWRAAAGGLVHEPGANGHRLGAFVVTGADAAEVEERADALLRRVRVHVRQATMGNNGPDQIRPASIWAIAP